MGSHFGCGHELPPDLNFSEKSVPSPILAGPYSTTRRSRPPSVVATRSAGNLRPEFGRISDENEFEDKELRQLRIGRRMLAAGGNSSPDNQRGHTDHGGVLSGAGGYRSEDT